MQKATGLNDQLKNWQVREGNNISLKDLETYLLSIFESRKNSNKDISGIILFSSEEDAEKWFNELYNPALQEVARKYLK